LNRHQSSGRLALGLSLATVTALLWGTLPVVTKLLVNWIDVYTLAWFRFLAASALLIPIVAHRRGLRSLLSVRKAPGLIVICILGLCGNNLAYISSLKFVPASAAQVMIQLSPGFVLFGGLLIFKENFGRTQWLGFVTLIFGMALFFNQRYDVLMNGGSAYLWGLLLVVGAAILWTGYILAQKQLQAAMSPEAILLVIYVASVFLLLPLARPMALRDLNGMQWTLLCVFAVMTVVSYVCFGSALNHLEASRSGVVVAVTPLITVGISRLAMPIFPEAIEVEALNVLGFIGAVLVVIGSALSALSRSRSPLRRDSSASSVISQPAD